MFRMFEWSNVSLLQQIPIVGAGGEDFHLMDGDFVEALQTLRLGDAVLQFSEGQAQTIQS